MKVDCVSCCAQNLDKDTIGINKKTLGVSIKKYYCLTCLASYLGTTVEDLQEQIAEYKEDDCIMFK